MKRGEVLHLRVAGEPLEQLKRQAEQLQIGTATIARAILIKALAAGIGVDSTDHAGSDGAR